MLKKLTVNEKTKAQGLVEFALILTLLLTLLYGILETGRLMFIYASTVTAARQAARYGSATGNSPATGNPLYYKDCANIRAAAQKVGFLNTFTNANIVITYDKGPGTTDLNWTCVTTFSGTDQGGIAATGDRVKVCVSTTWLPVIGALVPLSWGGTTNCSGVVTPNAITKSSERTIISSISIGVVAPGTGPLPGSGGLTLTCGAYDSAGQVLTTYDHVGQVITYKYKMTNAGSTDLMGAFTIASNNVFATCGAGYTIYPGKNLTCPGYYTITQADLDAGSVVNTASAYTTGASSLPCPTTVNSTPTKKLTLTISATSDAAGTQVITKAPVGTLIYYTYKLINSGNVTLTSPVYTVTDTLGSVTCPSPATLAPLGEIPCTTKSRAITATDVTAGKYVNTATLNYAQMSPTTQTATATVYTSKLVLTITTVPQTVERAGQVIDYTYSIYNNSGVGVTTSSLAITNTRFTPTTCPSSIPIGVSIDCTVSYTVTQADMDTGANVLQNTATANIGGVAASLPVTASIAVIQTDALALTISASATNTLVPAPLFPTVTATTGTFTFKYMLTNTGNTTLTLPALPYLIINPSTIRDGGTAPLHTPLSITCGTGDLLPAYIDSGGVLIPAQSTIPNFCYTSAINPTTNDLSGTYGAYITNLATANAVTKVGTRAVVSTQQTGLVATAGARLDVGITATLVGMQIQYTYRLTNTGNSEITLPASYSISTYTLTGTGITTPVPVSFVCAATSITIAINSSFACPNGSTYTTAQTTGSITNTVAPKTDPAALLVTSTPAITQLNLLCNVTNSGTVPDTIGNLTTWYIYNHATSAINITAITVEWNNDVPDFSNVKLNGISAWTGLTNTNGFTINKDTPSFPATTLSWVPGLNVNASSTTPLQLQFSNFTEHIRVILQFSQSACAPLDSGNIAQIEPCTTAPATPSGTPTAVKATNTITVNWTAVTGATSYKVYVSQNNGAYTLLASPSTNSYTHDISAFSTGTTFRYKISAVNACGESLPSAVSNIVTK